MVQNPLGPPPLVQRNHLFSWTEFKILRRERKKIGGKGMIPCRHQIFCQRKLSFA